MHTFSFGRWRSASYVFRVIVCCGCAREGRVLYFSSMELEEGFAVYSYGVFVGRHRPGDAGCESHGVHVAGI